MKSVRPAFTTRVASALSATGRSVLIVLVLVGLFTHFDVREARADDKDDAPKERLERLEALSDEQLREHLNGLLGKDFQREREYEGSLVEIVRRGKREWEPFLKASLDQLEKRKISRVEGQPDFDQPGELFNLELLTALRRVQGKPDPLTIEVDVDKTPLTVPRHALPQLKVKIKNVDAEKKAAGFTIGGDYRTGRQARWRVVVTDKKGESIPVKQPSGIGVIGGGQYQEGMLEFGEAWGTTLDLRSFVDPPPAGKYQLQVLYHNTCTIVSEDDISDLVVCKSKPIPLVIEKTVITLTKDEDRLARLALAEIDGTERLLIVSGTYGKWAHDDVKPGSSHGRLLSLGLKAAPAMIEVLQTEKTSPEQRAWLLSMLYSVTGENDPRNTDAISSYDEIEGPWEVWGGKTDEGQSGGIGVSSRGTVSSRGKIDTREQKQFVQKWAKWLDACDLKLTDKK